MPPPSLLSLISYRFHSPPHRALPSSGLLTSRFSLTRLHPPHPGASARHSRRAIANRALAQTPIAPAAPPHCVRRLARGPSPAEAGEGRAHRARTLITCRLSLITPPTQPPQAAHLLTSLFSLLTHPPHPQRTGRSLALAFLQYFRIPRKLAAPPFRHLRYFRLQRKFGGAAANPSVTYPHPHPHFRLPRPPQPTLYSQ